MIEIRIRKVYDGHRGAEQTYINLKQTRKGFVEYTEELWPGRNCRPIKGEPKTITSAEANRIFKELTETAEPYIRYSEDGLFEKMR